MPPSVANRKGLAPRLPPLVNMKSVLLPLKTIPVGLGGVLTTRDCGTPLPSYRVELSVPLSATQPKPLGLKAPPQAFPRWVSWLVMALYALRAMSETKPVALKLPGVAGGGRVGAGVKARPVSLPP